MHGIVLGAGMKLVILVAFAALKSLDHSLAHQAVHIWILAISLLTSSPTRVAEDIDIRRPEGEALVLSYSAVFAGYGVFSTRFVAHRSEHLFDQSVVKRARHAYA